VTCGGRAKEKQRGTKRGKRPKNGQRRKKQAKGRGPRVDKFSRAADVGGKDEKKDAFPEVKGGGENPEGGERGGGAQAMGKDKETKVRGRGKGSANEFSWSGSRGVPQPRGKKEKSDTRKGGKTQIWRSQNEGLKERRSDGGPCEKAGGHRIGTKKKVGGSGRAPVGKKTFKKRQTKGAEKSGGVSNNKVVGEKAGGEKRKDQGVEFHLYRGAASGGQRAKKKNTSSKRV